MARHRSPQSRHASLGLLSPQFAVAGAGGAGGFRTGGPYVRHSRSSTSLLGTPAGRVTAAVLAVAGIAGTAHLSTQGTLLPDTDEVSGWFTTGSGSADVAVPAPREPADDAPIADAATIAALSTTPAVTQSAGAVPARSVAATALTGAGVRDVAGRAASATQQARETARSVRAKQAAAASAAASSAAPAASTGSASAGTAGKKASASAAGGAVRIVSGRVTSGFGSRWGTAHQGLDIAAPIGTPINVPLAGTVISSGPASGFGMWVRVRHADGTVTVYGHINRSLVKVGQKVAAGQQIAEVGNRGQSTGPHLHIEVVTPGGTKVNPKPWLDQHGFRYGA
ncbi:peptidase M23-like protein [Pseudonocardia sediminis]|uniref:Peptidase M23-like protein n=1 Tax=Pseudonocardia sediminis TaxID=1397368 RepID=A0A4Q7V0T6_PSEST|nr:M23 family metallopeptidase [Pseudonocardia sediminis]RZT87044.1 peptidase M23-like protein [Pseudonocardia sediminis]